jgi:hypothetical protein
MKLEKLLLKIMNFLTLQKGRPYFFPNCKNEDLINKTNLQYKILSPESKLFPRFKTNSIIFL